MKMVDVAVIGTGWCGGIRAETLANHPMVERLHLAETRPERLAQVKAATKAATATADYRELLELADLQAVYTALGPMHGVYVK